MNDQQFHEYCEKMNVKKQRARDVVQQTGAIRREWVCNDCGSTLSWDSADHRQRHYKSRKHTQKAQGRIPK